MEVLFCFLLLHRNFCHVDLLDTSVLHFRNIVVAYWRTIVKHRISISLITQRTFTTIQSVSRYTVKTYVLFPFVTRGMLSYVFSRHTCCRVVMFMLHMLLLLFDSSKVVFSSEAQIYAQRLGVPVFEHYRFFF